MRFIFAILIILWPSFALAQGLFASDKVVEKTYIVTGESIAQLKASMSRRGPNGYWGYTRYNYRWDGRCNMRFEATVTMPKLKSRDMLSADDLAKWDRMRAALLEHEMGHVEIGRAWAGAIKKAKCRSADVKRIDAEFKGKDADFDRRTQHGRTTGVHF